MWQKAYANLNSQTTRLSVLYTNNYLSEKKTQLMPPGQFKILSVCFNCYWTSWICRREKNWKGSKKRLDFKLHSSKRGDSGQSSSSIQGSSRLKFKNPKGHWRNCLWNDTYSLKESFQQMANNPASSYCLNILQPNNNIQVIIMYWFVFTTEGRYCEKVGSPAVTSDNGISW